MADIYRVHGPPTVLGVLATVFSRSLSCGWFVSLLLLFLVAMCPQQNLRTVGYFRIFFFSLSPPSPLLLR